MRTIIGYIDGVPLYGDTEENERLFGNLFPGATINSDNKPLELLVGRTDYEKERNQMALSSGFGTNSIFYTPDVLHIDEKGKRTNTSANSGGRLEANKSTTKEQEIASFWYNFFDFKNLSDFNAFLTNQPTTSNSRNALSIFLNNKYEPRRMAVVFIENSTSSMHIACRFSTEAINYLVGSSDEFIDGYVKIVHAYAVKTYSGFRFSQQQLKSTFINFLPHINSYVTKSNNGMSSVQKKQYDVNYTYLMSIVANAKDPQTKAAVNALCILLKDLDADIVNIYNRNSVKWNYIESTPLTVDAIYHIMGQLKNIHKQVGKLQTSQFNSGDELVTFVNENFLDRSGSGRDTRHIINYPFLKLSYDVRLKLIKLLIDGRELGFGGYWRKVFANATDKVTHTTAGDILYILMDTSPLTDRIQLVKDLDADKKLIPLFSNAYLECFTWLVKFIGETKLIGMDVQQKETAFQTAIDSGNIIFFDGAFFGNRQIEHIDAQAQKFTVETKESPLYNSLILALCKNFIDKHLANDAHNLLFNKKSFDPLEMIILIPTGNEETDVLGKIEKGQAMMLPACMVYALFREDTYEAVKILGELAFQVGLCFVGVGALSAAIRIGRTLGIFLEATDMTLGVLGATINTIPEISRNHPQFVKYTNYAILVYGLARLGYAGYSGLKVPKIELDNYDDIIKQLYTRPKGLFPKLNSMILYLKFGKNGVKLVDNVECEWNLLQKTLIKGNQKGEKVLVSGMIDKETGQVSKVFSNFTREELTKNLHLEFMDKLHPTLKKRWQLHFNKAGLNGEGLNLADPDVYKFAWKSENIAHAEFRALDDILKKIDPSGTLGETAIERIMGYNSFLRKSGIQHTCADCFYLTYGVTFIK